MNVHRELSSFKRDLLPIPRGNSFVRLITARSIAQMKKGVSAEDVVEKLWPNDRLVAQLVTRASTAPALTTVTGWAAELAHTVVADALEALGPASAAAALLKQGLVLTFDGYAGISVPNFVAAAGNASFVAESNPIPVRQLSSTPALLTPTKLATISVLTIEMMESSNAEQLIGDVLIRSAGLALDAVLFGTAAASSAQPAGLRNGIAATTASASTSEAFIEDIGALSSAVSAVAGNGRIVLVASPGRVVTMGIRYINDAGNVQVLGSSAVGNDVLAIAPAGLVAALSPEPEIETANAATLHMDTAPAALLTAAPVRSLYQTSSIAIKMRWPVTWALRTPAALAWVTPPVWK